MKMTPDGIAFEPLPDMPTPEITLTTKPEPAPQPDPDAPEPQPAEIAKPIPPSTPKMVYRIGGKIIGCPAFELDEEEARAVADAMTLLIGNRSPRTIAALTILAVTLEKIAGCQQAIKAKFSRRGTHAN